MKSINIVRIIVIMLSLQFLISCEEESKLVTIVETISAVSIGHNAAMVTGRIKELSDAEHGDYGFCYATNDTPSINDSVLVIGTAPVDTGIVTGQLTQLIPKTNYYVRTYIREKNDYKYGKVKSFFSYKPTQPVISTSTPTDIYSTSATCGGNITYDGDTQIAERGVCWSVSQNPTTKNNKTDEGTGSGIYTSTITGLTPNTTYYVRAYAENIYGTSYGNEVIITTKGLPIVITTTPTDIDTTSVTCGGNITSDGGSTVTERGVCWNTSPNPAYENSHINSGTGTGTFTVTPTGLNKSTTYYVKAYARNIIGISYGNEVIFTTNGPPIVSTSSVIVGSSTSLSGGNITFDGGTPIIERGVCWSTSPNPSTIDYKTSDGTDSGIYVSIMIGLNPNATYYVKAFAMNKYGMSYGNERSFTTLYSVTDIDGNIYNTITIGTQVWMTENLKTTRYRNGDTIAHVTDNTAWLNLTTAAYCYYNNDINNTAIYGRMYNWYAVSDNRNIAPTGWHAATDTDWETLVNYLGALYAGGKLKEAGTAHWNSPNSGATNESGFTALPGGYRSSNGSFYSMSSSGYWWSTTEYSPTSVWQRRMNNSNSGVDRFSGSKKYGLSIRCVKD